MQKINILTNLLVSLKTNYIINNKFAFCKFNKFCLNLLHLLYRDGLISGYKVDKVLNKIKIKLKYFHNKPVISDFQLISKPSMQLYCTFDELKEYSKKFDYFFISTSQGILSSSDLLRNYKIGGKLLFGLKLNLK